LALLPAAIRGGGVPGLGSGDREALPELASCGKAFTSKVRCEDNAIEWEYPSRDRSYVDFCLVMNGGYAASLEIKGPCGIGGSNNPLKQAPRTLNQSIQDVSERHSNWSVVPQTERATEALSRCRI
jgi:hypothetical protein